MNPIRIANALGNRNFFSIILTPSWQSGTCKIICYPVNPGNFSIFSIRWQAANIVGMALVDWAIDHVGYQGQVKVRSAKIGERSRYENIF
jgi:hypothetical protein